ncbi:Zn-dependent hydrolase [Bacillota bacterium]
MKINKERLLLDLSALREITDTPGEGVTRFSYGEKDRVAREYILRAANAAGLASRTDSVGNIYFGPDESCLGLNGIAPEGSNNGQGKIIIGSHIDTVQNGGWLDGTYGVIAALEAMRVMAEKGLLGEKKVELVIFAEEEGSNFGSCMTGSKFVTGAYGAENLRSLKNDRGITMGQMLGECGYEKYEEKTPVWDFSRVKAMLELHIEQGPVLDEKGIPLGIVEWINGMSVREFTLCGVGNHSGGTPMSYRKDALAAAARCILAAQAMAEGDPEGITVATVGKLEAYPNCSNVIPEKVIFTVEVRDKDNDKIKRLMEGITETILSIAAEQEMECHMREVAASAPIKLDGNIIKIIEAQAIKSGLSYLVMNSGAVHDAAMIAAHAPAGMIFVPSINGRSHVAIEDTDPDDLFTGAQLLLDTVMAL